MSTLSPIRVRACRSCRLDLPSRRLRRFAFHCEPLELRQLLSVGQVGYCGQPVISPIVAQPASRSRRLFSSANSDGLCRPARSAAPTA